MRDIIELNAGWHLGPGGTAETVFRLPCALRHEADASLVLSKQFHVSEKWQGTAPFRFPSTDKNWTRFFLRPFLRPRSAHFSAMGKTTCLNYL